MYIICHEEMKVYKVHGVDNLYAGFSKTESDK